MYKMTLADGAEIEFAGMNGDNLIVPDQKEMDESVFTDDNLKSCTFEDEDGNKYEYENLSFIQQQKQKNGDYYICFYQKSAQQVDMEEIRDLIIDLAEIEVSDGNLELEDIPAGLQDAVRVKLDDSKWKDK